MLLLCQQAQIHSPETLFDIKTGNPFLDNNDKSLVQTHICKKIGTYSLSSMTEAL